MRKTWWAAFALALLGILTLVTACSDNSSTNPLPPGDPADPDFQFVEEAVFSEVFGGVDLALELSTSLVDSIPGALAGRGHFGGTPAIDGDLVVTSLTYSFDSDWHVFTVWGYLAPWGNVDTVDFNGVDSIQILADGVAQQVPDESTNEISFRASMDAAARSGDATRSGTHVVSMKLIDPVTDQVRLDGQVEESIYFVHTDSTTTCDVNVSNSFSASNVVFDFAVDGCPVSGDIQATVVLGADCTGQDFTLNVDGTWSTRALYENGTETVTFSNGNNVWTVVNDCNGGPAASLRW